MSRRIGAYILPGDPVWLRRSLRQYYPLLDELVVTIPRGSRGWRDSVIPVQECLEIVREVDVRRIMRTVEGSWIDVERPMDADTAQRQAALDALRDRVDWVVQIDNDEFLPQADTLTRLMDRAEREGVDIVEAPMTVLFRRARGAVLQVAAADGSDFHEFPGPILVRPTARLRNARRAEGPFLRATAPGASSSLQLARPPEADELRRQVLSPGEVIVHNSWARTPGEIRRKGASWGHGGGFAFQRYYRFVWLPSPWTWRVLRDLHPFERGLWPRLRRVPDVGAVSDGVAT